MTQMMPTPKSSNIKSIGYDPDTSTLTVIFRSGGTYEYYNVPLAMYDKFQHASSYGRFFHMFIKPQFDYKKVSK